jgi:hypothetical protein
MLIGAVHGYRGLIRQLIRELKEELQVRQLPVVATGGYSRLIASTLDEITAVDPLLTLEGLRLVWQFRAPPLPASLPPRRDPAAQHRPAALRSRGPRKTAG